MIALEKIKEGRKLIRQREQERLIFEKKFDQDVSLSPIDELLILLKKQETNDV
jgi:hypothetical protein